MADNGNKELMDFIEKKFDGIENQFNNFEKQFEGVYKRLDNTATKDDLANFATKDDLANFATKDDLANFATKDDLANFATKDDLANFATKDDLANFATKDDLANFATKDDLANFATKDDLEVATNAAKEETMRHTGVLIEAVDHKLDIVIEGVMTVNERLDRRMDENEQEHGRLEKMTLINTADISKLDQRVGKLEGRV
jgi:hypothetical protein